MNLDLILGSRVYNWTTLEICFSLLVVEFSLGFGKLGTFLDSSNLYLCARIKINNKSYSDSIEMLVDLMLLSP